MSSTPTRFRHIVPSVSPGAFRPAARRAGIADRAERSGAFRVAGKIRALPIP